MARIRTIKPEFPQSESMGKVSRDARLCFVMMWTISDDSGRLRGNSRMLASLLFPYDDDAPSLIEGWLEELATNNCIIRYEVSGSHYIQIVKWLEHQKIDKPSPSKIPSFGCNSRSLANVRECSSGDLGPRTKDQGPSNSVKDATALPVASSGSDPCKIIDPGKVLFDEGVKLFGLYGIADRNARSVLARWQKAHGTQAALEAVMNAGKAERSDVVAFIEGSFRARAPTGRQRNGRGQEAIEFLLGD